MSNRNDFQEMREQEAQESPVIEREEEREPKALSNLEKRVYAYESKVLRNKVNKYGLEHVLKERKRNYTDLSALDNGPLHNHAKPLTAMQKLYHIPNKQHDEKELPTTEDVKESFRNFRKSRGI